MNHPVAIQRRLRLAQLASSTGAGVLGFGLGAVAARWVGALAVPTVVVGILLHAMGMFSQHRLEAAAEQPDPWWSAALYWFCWIALALLVGAVVLRAFDRLAP
jgi:hypothetical protein